MRHRPTTPVPKMLKASSSSTGTAGSTNSNTRGASAMMAKERHRSPPHVSTAVASKGRSGFESLVSLLIAMESDGFVVRDSRLRYCINVGRYSTARQTTFAPPPLSLTRTHAHTHTRTLAR